MNHASFLQGPGLINSNQFCFLEQMVNWAPGMRLQMADTAGGLKMSTAEIIGLIEILRSAAPGLIVKKLRKSNYSYKKVVIPRILVLASLACRRHLFGVKFDTHSHVGYI